MLADNYYGARGLSAADVAAVVGNQNGNGFMNGCGMYGMYDMWWILILFLFCNNGWGNNGNNGNNMLPYLMNNGQSSEVQRGFDQQALMSAIQGVSAATTNGFSDQAVSQCNQTTTLLTNLNNLGSQITNGNYNLSQMMTNYEMNRQQCCCDNKQLIADLKSTIIQEASNTRAASSAGTQAILDRLCQQEINSLKESNQNLRTENTLLGLTASQQNQTQNLIANNAAQTDRLLDILAPQARPCYSVPNPNGCGCYRTTNCGYGCA